MVKTLMNLTLPLVIEEIDKIVNTYPEYPYRIAFSPAGLRQDLLAYVLSRIPNTYTVVEETSNSSNSTVIPRCSREQRLQIEHMIHLGIRDVLHVYNRPHFNMPSP